MGYLKPGSESGSCELNSISSAPGVLAIERETSGTVKEKLLQDTSALSILSFFGKTDF